VEEDQKPNNFSEYLAVEKVQKPNNFQISTPETDPFKTDLSA